ncbi:S8 family serine peptidase, partial [Massilia glaciei]|uniref:S8 family serine peptidase n=1 Tax=Massilia glaciei TaxID=1524097 RepID=UPI001C639687
RPPPPPDRLARLGVADAEALSPNSARVRAPAGALDAAKAGAGAHASTAPSYYTADTGEEFLATGRIFVTFRQPPSAQELDLFAGRYGLVKRQMYSEREGLFQLTLHTGMDAVALVVELTERERLVDMAENDLNYRAQTYQLAIPSDPAYAQQWHLHDIADPAFDHRASTNCEAAWRLLDHYGDADVVVGVTDDGCKLSHPDFDSPGKFAGWGYFRGERLVARGDIDADPAQMYKNGANHGTSCAGVIAGEADAVLTVGAAPGCRLLPIQWESSGQSLFISDSKLRTAIDFLADKVDVMSNSWGMSPRAEHAQQVLRRIAELSAAGGRRGKGIVFLWARATGIVRSNTPPRSTCPSTTAGASTPTAPAAGSVCAPRANSGTTWRTSTA